MTSPEETTHTPDQYRINTADHSIYEYSKESQAYFYIGNYVNFGIKGRDSRATMIKKIDAIEESTQ